jgi:integrase
VTATTEERLADIHGADSAISGLTSALKSGRIIGGNRAIPKEARDAILEFCRARRDEVSTLRFKNYLVRLPQIADRLGKDFLEPTRDTPSKFKAAYPADRYKVASREGTWYVARAFWSWRFDRKGEPVPYYLRMKFPKNGKPRIGPAEVLIRDDVAKIAEAATTLRDRAWIWTLYNSRARPGEIYRLRVGDVTRRDGYLELAVNREKGGNERPAPVYEDAVPALLAYLDSHPFKDDPKAPLWVSVEGHGKKRGELVGYREMFKATTIAARKAGVLKPAHPYAFRHAGLTDLAKDPRIPESILAASAGWVPGSRRARTYVHVSNCDVTAALNVRYGITSPDSTQPATHPAVKCGRCGDMTRPDANFCLRCGGPLTIDGVKERQDDAELATELREILRNPKVVRAITAELRRRKVATVAA